MLVEERGWENPGKEERARAKLYYVIISNLEIMTCVPVRAGDCFLQLSDRCY